MSTTIRTHKTPEGKIAYVVEMGNHSLVADEPSPVGEDRGPDPFDLLDGALAACTALTVTLVAQRKQWPLKDVRVALTHDKDDATYRMDRRIELVGELTEEQRQYLLGIANKCPVHKTLHKKFEITTALTPAP
jgi:putative redox protein